MRFKKLIFGIAVSALTVGSACDVCLSQEEGRRGPPGGDRGGPPGGGDRGRGGPPGGFSGRTAGGGGIQGLLRMEEVQKELALTEQQKMDLSALAERMRDSFGGGRGPGGRPEGGRPEGGRPEGGRPEGGRPEGGRPEGGRPEGGRPPGGGFGFSPDQMKEMMARLAEARDKSENEIMTAILDPDQGDRALGLLIQLEDGRSLTSQALSDALGFSPEQKQKVKTATENFSTERMKMMESAMRGGGGPSPEVMAQMEALNKKSNGELLAVMTPEQKAKFESMKGAKFTFPEPRSFGFGGPGGGNRTRGGPPGEGGPPREGGRPGRPSGPGT